MRKRRYWHIQPRVFITLLLLLALVFAGVFLAFNVFIRNYIKLNIETAFDTVLNNVSGQSGNLDSSFARNRSDNKHYPNEKNDVPTLSGVPVDRIGTEVKLFVVDQNYTLLDYSSEENVEELSEITAYLIEKNIPLGNEGFLSFKTQVGDYYMTSKNDPLRRDAFMILFVNVASYKRLIETVNVSLGVIMAMGMLVCFIVGNVLANSITRPVKKLSDFALQIGKGNFTQRDFSFTDIEFNELATVMNQSAEKLNKYDADQRTFFQNVSHELRSPLMSIRCYAEGIACGVMEAKKASDTIIIQTDRLTELVEDLLFISRVDNISNQAEIQEGDLRDVVSLCGESLKSIANKGGILVEYEFDDAPVLMMYNEKYIYRAIVNLLSNALRYAKNSIRLRCYNTTEGVEIAVKDDGGGIGAEDLPHIYERFYKGKGGKHGIGLAIVKAVVEQYGGNIAYQYHEGTEFTISFPRKDI